MVRFGLLCLRFDLDEKFLELSSAGLLIVYGDDFSEFLKMLGILGDFGDQGGLVGSDDELRGSVLEVFQFLLSLVEVCLDSVDLGLLSLDLVLPNLLGTSTGSLVLRHFDYLL